MGFWDFTYIALCVIQSACIIYVLTELDSELIFIQYSHVILKMNSHQTICARVKSRNKSRLLLNLYLNINNKDVERNEMLLDVIAQSRLYQVRARGLRNAGNAGPTVGPKGQILMSLRQDRGSTSTTKM